MTRRQLRHWALWSALTLGLLLTFFSLFYFKAFDLPNAALGRLFVALALPGHFVFLGFLVCLPALVVSQIVPSRRLTGILLGLPAVALAVVVTIDINTFELYRFHLNRMVWELFTGGGAGDIFAFSTLDVFLILSLFAGVSVLAVAVVWMARRQVERGRRGRWPALLILLVMA
ncbi:MAG: DUF3413 domain-containing protein [Pseudomonadota bacterium]